MGDDVLGPREDLPGPAVLGFLACAATVRRDAYLGAGGFDDVIFFYGEEQKLALDLAVAGWGLAYVPDLIVHHHPSPARDPLARRRLAVRNDVLTALMRRPWPVVARQVARSLRTDRSVAQACWTLCPALRARWHGVVGCPTGWSPRYAGWRPQTRAEPHGAAQYSDRRPDPPDPEGDQCLLTVCCPPRRRPTSWR
jgi:hypothetical protein